MRRRAHLSLLLIASLALPAGCESFPRDPEHTAERTQRSGLLRVGVTEHAPFVERADGGEPVGLEVALVREFAAERHLRVRWHWGQEEMLLQALERFELDLVIGGIDEQTPWSERVGLTRPWHEQPSGPKRALAIPPGENAWLGELERFLDRVRSKYDGAALEAAR